MSQPAKSPPKSPAKPAAKVAPVPAAKPAPAANPKPAPKAPAKAPTKTSAKKPGRPMAKRAKRRRRHSSLILAFLVMVTLPIGATAWYLFARAVDQYATTLGFTVRSEDPAGAADILGNLGGSFGSNTSTRDTDILFEFIRSQELVALIDGRLDLRAMYTLRAEEDPLFSFESDGHHRGHDPLLAADGADFL